jgi:hypothetical protein
LASEQDQWPVTCDQQTTVPLNHLDRASRYWLAVSLIAGEARAARKIGCFGETANSEGS